MAFVGREVPLLGEATKGKIVVSAPMNTLVFTVVLRWNTRAGLWMASVYDPTNRPIERDIFVREGEDILENVIRPFAPIGAIVCRDISGGDRDPGRDGWRNGITLKYEYEVPDA